MRAAYGFPRRVRSRSGSDITAVFGFLALLRKAIRESGLRLECVVLFDCEGSWETRLRADPAYKSNRCTDAPMTPERSELVGRAFELYPVLTQGLDILRVKWAEAARHEADDAIATLARRAARRHREVVIMSPDRDFFQLLSPSVRIMNTLRHPDRWFVEPGEVVSRYGVWPHQWCDFRALTGDPSDGISGVRGVGPVRASRFLHGGLSLDDLPSSGRLVGRWGEAVLERWRDVLGWRDLIRLRRDAEVPIRTTGRATPEMPKAADTVDRLGLWA